VSGTIISTSGRMLNGYRQRSPWLQVALGPGRALSAFVAAIPIGASPGIAMGVAPNFGLLIHPFAQFLRSLPHCTLRPKVSALVRHRGRKPQRFVIF
jgi:ABC-type nitrate/sulfonate/bicarbonate transport system permease component